MIEVSAATAFLLYLTFTMALLLGIWISQHYRTRHYKLRIEMQNLQVCEYCHTAYMADIGKKVTRCPCCESYNS